MTSQTYCRPNIRLLYGCDRWAPAFLSMRQPWVNIWKTLMALCDVIPAYVGRLAMIDWKTSCISCGWRWCAPCQTFSKKYRMATLKWSVPGRFFWCGLRCRLATGTHAGAPYAAYGWSKCIVALTRLRRRCFTRRSFFKKRVEVLLVGCWEPHIAQGWSINRLLCNYVLGNGTWLHVAGSVRPTFCALWWAYIGLKPNLPGCLFRVTGLSWLRFAYVSTSGSQGHWVFHEFLPHPYTPNAEDLEDPKHCLSRRCEHCHEGFLILRITTTYI